VTPERRVRLERRVALTVVLLGALWIGLWHPGERDPFWQGIEGRLLDARFVVRGPLRPPEQIAIVAFDDAALAQMGTFPPSRARLSAAVTGAWAAGARAVALDFLLVDSRSDDAGLALALSQGAAILGVAEAVSTTTPWALHGRGGLATTVTVPDEGSVLRPLPALGPAQVLQEAAGLGHVTVEHGPDGALRRMRPVLALATANGVVHVPGLAIAAVATHAGPASYRLNAGGVGGRLEIGPTSLPLDLGGNLVLDFHGPAGSIATYSAASVKSADLRGKIVFFGATATGFGDRHASPFDATLPGVELHATLAANVLAGRLLRRDAVVWSASVSLAVLAALAGFLAAGRGRPAMAAGAIGLATVTISAALQAAFVAGWWLDASTALLSLALGIAAVAALQQVHQRQRATHLARDPSPARVEVLATTADALQRQPPQPAVVVFVELAGFTTCAERAGPASTHTLLARFTRLVDEAADRCNGLVAGFAGDSALVVFGVPQPATNDVERALQFIEQLSAAVRDRVEWPGLGLRVSGHAGPVQVGIPGSDRHRRVSVSGDGVDTANRLLDCARSSDTSMALSGAIVTASPEARRWAERAGLKPMAWQPLKDRARFEEVWVGEPPAGGGGVSGMR
jgi:adenylate cyclase